MPRHYNPYAAYDACRKAFPDDTIDAVFLDFGDVFEKRPPVADDLAPIIRALGMELSLGGLRSRCQGDKIQVAVVKTGIRIFPHPVDEHLGVVAEAYEILARREVRSNA